jgi:hypothetical protein
MPEAHRSQSDRLADRERSVRTLRPIIEGDLARAIGLLSAKHGESTVEYIRRTLAVAIAAELDADPVGAAVLDVAGVRLPLITVMA